MSTVHVEKRKVHVQRNEVHVERMSLKVFLFTGDVSGLFSFVSRASEVVPSSSVSDLYGK